jgi:hypothetical protein
MCGLQSRDVLPKICGFLTTERNALLEFGNLARYGADQPGLIPQYEGTSRKSRA